MGYNDNRLAANLMIIIAGVIIGMIVGTIIFKPYFLSTSEEDKVEETETDFSDLPYYGQHDDHGYSTSESWQSDFYILSDHAIPDEQTGIEIPAHYTDWHITTLVDRGTDTEYLIIYKENDPSKITCVERRKYEEEPIDK